jgi:hypothetical protein
MLSALLETIATLGILVSLAAKFGNPSGHAMAWLLADSSLSLKDCFRPRAGVRAGSK